MAFKLPESVMARIREQRNADAGYKAVFANLSDDDLVASARFWMAHCEAPRRHKPGEPVYDSTFWHIIVPELLRRLEGRP